MSHENKYSRNNMLINTYYIDQQIERNKRYPVIKFFISVMRRSVRILKHILEMPKNGVLKTGILIRAELSPKYLQDYECLTGFDHDYELNYRFKNEERPKVAVYTAIFGSYDSVKEPFFASENCDYYIITDMEVPKDSIWQKYSVEDETFNKMDNYHKSKYCKLHPHILFPEYKYSIWIDGNVQIVADLQPLVDRMNPDCSMATFQNPLHDCIYTERNFLIYSNAVKLSDIDRQLADYRKEGFPKHFGMREFSIIVRKHHELKLVGLMEQWWKEVNTYTMRDQISFPYLLWKNGLEIDYIQLLGMNWRNNPRFIVSPHNWRIVFKK